MRRVLPISLHVYEEDPAFHRLERQISGTSDRSQARDLDVVQRPLGCSVYYHESSDAFYFSAEAKSIRRVHPAPPDLRAWVSWSPAAACSSWTVFDGIKVLPSGAT